ncbi:MAG: hypothetical protein J7M14_02290 [Planctomycetes bacterium]|nr:hypothetical protein [Planctomycetota bacterium]
MVDDIICAEDPDTVAGVIVESHLDEKTRELGEYLAGRLESLKDLGVVREVRGKGVLRGARRRHRDASPARNHRYFQLHMAAARG